MPRQDVPYGGAICRLKERIAEIWDKLGEKLHTINGVPGDGDGNVKIVSGSSAVVINNDPTQNEIEVSLDTSQLPAASVSSVNGQTGAVALDAGDIPTVSGDVQSDIQDLANDISGNTAAINAEVLARQQADAALQTNINAALASIPDMSVTPDPYKGVERDAQGRAFAADPESGATDKSLTTANWISQSGDNGPNNLIHKNGYETVTERKYFERGLSGVFPLGTHIGSTLGHYVIATIRSGLEVSPTRYFINGIISDRGATSLFNIEILVGTNTESITMAKTNALSTYGSITNRTAIGIDVVNNELKLVVNRANSNNVQTRIQILHIQRANQGYITNTLYPLEEGEAYTPSSLLAEGFVI